MGSNQLPPHQPENPVWYYRRVGREYGPVALGHIIQLAREGKLHKSLDYVRHGVDGKWLPSAAVEGVHLQVQSRVEIDAAFIAQEIWRKQPPIRMPEVVRANPARWSRLVWIAILLFILAHILGNSIGSHVYSLEIGGDTKHVLLGIEIARYVSYLAVAMLYLAQIQLAYWVYHAWRIVRCARASMPPWLAAVLLLVPGLNLIWNFFALWMWAQEYRVLLHSNPQFRHCHRPRENLILAACIYPLLSPLVHVVLMAIAARIVGVLGAVILAHQLTLLMLLVNLMIWFILTAKMVHDIARAVDDINDLNMRR